MGITNLLPFLKPIAKSTHISKYKNEVIGVDIMCWIHRGLISCAYDVVTDNHNDSYLSFIEKMLECIYHYNIKVVFVFDGEELPEKKAENVIRKERREKAKKEAQEIIKSVENPRSNEAVIKKCTQALSVSKDMINTVMNFCKTKNIDYIISPFEADAQLSYLCRMGYISCAISEDSDLLVYGCPRVLYKLKSNGECDEISLMPIDDLIDINVINKIRNPLSNSFNQFYMTPMKDGQKDVEEEGHSDWEDNNMPDLVERHCVEENQNPEQIEQNYNNVMKDYMDQFYWPEELDKLKHFNIDMFLAMCVLSGCDYTTDFHITGMGIKTAFNLISQHKTIENIFSFLISHDKWKRKIPPSLNTLEKLMGKYEEIKNAFLHHQVYDFILCQNIPISRSFNSALKESENKLLINKIRDISLIYDNSKRTGNCLNVYSEDLSSFSSGEKSSLHPHGSNTSERCTERTTTGEEKVDTPKQHHHKDMLEGNVSPEARSNTYSVSPKQTYIKEQTYITDNRPNDFEHIFKNLTSECLEYLEISPGRYRNSHEGQNDLKEQEEPRHEGAGTHPFDKDYVGSAQEDSHGSSGWTSGWKNDKKNYLSCHPGEHPPNVTHKQEPFEAVTQTISHINPRGTTQTANLSPPMECTKLSKRKGNHDDSVNFKKTKWSDATPSHSDDQTWRNMLDGMESDCSKLSSQKNHGEVLKNTKWISQSGDNSQGGTRLKRPTPHKFDTSIDEDATKWKSQKQHKEEGKEESEEKEVTNPTGETNRKKSARVMYQNMKSSFLLYKTLDEETNTHMGSSSTELKHNSSQEKVKYAHVKEIQGMCKAERPDEKGGTYVETDIWDRKDKIRSGAQGKPISTPIADETPRVKDQMNVKSERSDHPSDISSPFKSKFSEINGNHKSQLQITNFFKKSEREKPNLDGKKEGNNNAFPFTRPRIGSPSGNGKYSLSMNNYEQVNTEKQRASYPNELGIYDARMDGRMTKYNHKFPVQSNTEQKGGGLHYVGHEIHHEDAHQIDTQDEYVFLKNLHNSGLIKEPNRKESPKCVIRDTQTWNDRVSRKDGDYKGEVPRSDHHNDRSVDHPSHHHDRPFLGDTCHAQRSAEKKEKKKEINLEYILQNLNYNYHPRSHKSNTFDYFKEKENVPPPNPYVDNNL
ncbi:hypothetical protein AK88_02440 [Plasmodium fragile]|uniref:Exonuclease 1 n=1 Tax=Plasmodium fragile TaxID=5857 RepID=A0A0D9QQ68_PLAFR|nr:uncharacterized protein AK88_02440 [Plasmodium fragile]KJP87836.1 hypothetical protein AK88_02440 [Plasmodium fragile]